MPLTLGIDLASQPRKTGACLIDWEGSSPRVVPFQEAIGPTPTLDDGTLVDLICSNDLDKVAIDAPFGWPVEFAEAVWAWKERLEWPITISDPGEQALLIHRETDRNVMRVTSLPLGAGGMERRSKRPLSVTSDRIAFAAMRCARILAEVQQRGIAIDRAGRGLVAEVYPDAALREWGLWPADWDRQHLSYKGKGANPDIQRGALFQELVGEVGGWLEDDEEHAQLCRTNDDSLDALICALVARAVWLGLTRPIDDVERASSEGWIHLPKGGTLGQLTSS